MRGHVSSTAIRNSAMMLVSRRGAARGGTDIGGARSHTTSGLHGCAGTCGCTLRERGILNRKDNWRSGYIMSATIRQETLL